jgi:hypothetical protein
MDPTSVQIEPGVTTHLRVADLANPTTEEATQLGALKIAARSSLTLGQAEALDQADRQEMLARIGT